MGRGGAIVLGLLAVVAGVFFAALIVVPWLAFVGTVAIPGVHFGQPRPSPSVTDVASVTVAGSTGLLALLTALLAIHTRRAVVEARRESKVAEETLQSGQEQVKVALQQVTVGREQVEASNRQATVAQRALEASFRPLLADVPLGFRSYPGDGRLVEVVRDQFEKVLDESQVVAEADFGRPGFYSVALRNVGTGPAVVTDVRLKAGAVDLKQCTISAAVVPPGEVTRFTFSIPADRDDLVPFRNEIQRSATMLVVVGYTDQAGIHRIRTEARLSRYRDEEGESRWYVRQIATFDGEGAEPVTMSAPADPHGIPR